MTLNLLQGENKGNTNKLADIIYLQLAVFADDGPSAAVATAANLFQLEHLRKAVLFKLGERNVDYDLAGTDIHVGNKSLMFVIPNAEDITEINPSYIYIDNSDLLPEEFFDGLLELRATAIFVETESA